MALAKGFRKLWEGEDIAPAYPGVVVAARAEWLRANEEAALRYLRGLKEANAWAPQNGEEAVASLVAARYSEGAAKRLVRDIVPDLDPSLAGWNEVVSLRRECGLLPSPEPKAAEVINRALLARA
jgi:ABC-type nitrate/sulfonate/bicarbonate transport system substrate-binding protein